MSARASMSRPVVPHVARVAGLVLLAGTVATFHVWARTRVVQEGYRLASVQQEHTRLNSERDRLKLEVEALTTPRTLEVFARTRLGMAPPDPGPVWAGRAVGGVDHLSGPAGPSLSTSAVALRAPKASRAR